MTELRVEEVLDCLQTYGQRAIVVLSGVPGTGKTHYALKAAEKLSGSPLLVKQVQFHPTYTYEDLMEGLRPNPIGGFDIVNGALVEWNDQALRDPENKYVFLIEEMTRANVSSVLGELFTYIEYRERFFQLPISKRQIRVAPNLYILATMNPQDKSALELDDALLRRMRVVTFPPSLTELSNILDLSLGVVASEESKRIRDGLNSLFETCRLRFPDFEDMMPFGHAVFSGVRSEDQLKELWSQQLKLLLQRNPHVPAHPYSEVIKEVYPWRS